MDRDTKSSIWSCQITAEKRIDKGAWKRATNRNTDNCVYNWDCDRKKVKFATMNAVKFVTAHEVINSIDSMAESMKQGTAVTTEMAQAINNTPAQKFQVLKQQIHNNVEELGNGLLPVVNETMDKVSGLIQKGSEWISTNQETVHTIMNIALKLGTVLTVLGTVVGTVGTVGKAILSAKSAIHAAKAAWAVLSSGFLASPVGWVILGIVALVASLVLLWNKSEAFRNFMMGLFGNVKTAVMDAWSTLQPALQNLGQKFMELYVAAQPILNVIRKIAEVIATVFLAECVGAFQGVLAALTPLTNAFSSLVSFVTNVINAIVALFKGDFAGACDFLTAAVDDVKNFFINGFDAILSFLGGFADGFLSVVGGALDAVGIDASGAISKIKDTVHSGLDAVKGFFQTTLGAAAETAKSNLNNIKNAFQQNGGGIKGIAAAALEGVKGFFTSKLSFIDNLTNGKLSSIKNKFVNGLEGALGAVNSKMESIKNKFNEKMTAAGNLVNAGIQAMKNLFNIDFPIPRIKLPHISVSGSFSLKPPSAPSFAINWYADGGIMTAPTIFGAAGGSLLGGGEAGDEAILPLSVLWEKLDKFIHNALKKGDEEKDGSGIQGIFRELAKKETRTVERKGTSSSGTGTQGFKHGEDKKTIIQKLEIKVDISKLKDLPMLFKLIDELKDEQNSTDNE